MKDKISIFDTGPGMDASDENSIVKWGKMGASLHRSFKAKAIGVKPPYLIPYFGMFGYGGPIATMHLGRRALVSSKTKESRKVFTLHLEREALLRSSGSEPTWKTSGGMRDPSEDEIGKSPQGSFTKVEILEPKVRDLDRFQLQCKLKDIYFPYIQCDEVSKTGKTTRPVEFQVNGIDLAEIDGGEVSITNLHSCNGPEFVFQLCFSIKQDVASTRSSGSRASQEANARIKCVYFPISEGKESIEKILENLEDQGCGNGESFETFTRVSIRRLGRLLPDARWACLPFMEFKQKKGDKAHILKRCCLRVKCFIETDAGFNPTPSKTDLAHCNPFTIALKNFSHKMPEKEKEVNVDISRNGKLLSPSHLEKEYEDWILEMHSQYDTEVSAGEDDGVLVVGPTNKIPGISSDVVRVRDTLTRKGAIWKRGQKIKVLKGAGPGFHNKNVYLTLEHFLIEGVQGDAGGDARIICRPLDIAEENGCVLSVKDEIARFDIRSSISIPISMIDSGKCQTIESSEWNCQLQKQSQKAPSTIEVLGRKHCQELEIDGGFPAESTVEAGCTPPTEIVAVVRPGCYVSSSHSKILDQKYIVKTNLEMSIEVKIRKSAEECQNVGHIYSARIGPSSHKGFDGLYIFSLGCKFPNLFKEAGVYTFLFTLSDNNCKKYEKRLMVKASREVGKWKLLGDIQGKPCVRVGSRFPSLSIGCLDIYGNQIPFKSVPEITVRLDSIMGVLAEIDKFKKGLSSDKLALKVQNMLIVSDKLDRIRPEYEATLVICPVDGLVSVSIPCQVMPGSVQHITGQPPIQEKHLLPGFVVKELVLKMLDAHGNHIKKGLEVQLNVDGFHILDKEGSKRKVDKDGCIDLSGVLKVTAGFGRIVSYSVSYQDKVVFKQELQTEKRELRIASKLPEFLTAGSDLENIVFEVVDSQGDVDPRIHNEEKAGQCHSLTIKSDSFNLQDAIQYTLRHGRCAILAIRIPPIEGSFCFIAAHSCYSELQLRVILPVMKAPIVECDENLSPYSSRKVPLLRDSLSLEHTESLMTPIENNEKGLVDDIEKYGERIGNSERQLKVLNEKKTEIEEYVSGLQASMERTLNNSNYVLTKEEILVQIESRNHSAASILCHCYRDLSSQVPQNHFMEGIFGLVALLGTVRTNKLSRILAEFLGEDQMLAVVCRSKEAASAFGKSICGRFLVICLEDIRPYTGELECGDPQRKLKLQDPTLQCGNVPSGFIGYAANMINIDTRDMNISTASGYGLRETLFYRLFGELQVYDTKEHMNEAGACIKHGAVSLDGGINRVTENGIMSLGCWDSEICFPVGTLENEMSPAPERMKIQMQLEAGMEMLQDITGQIELVTRLRENALKKLKKKSKNYSKLMDHVEAVESLRNRK
ncbi:structural maintenance of chromosomes flexible hinge domain-containing protein GMI1 isoform X2 [Populus trichocarpa]|nr:structural maintenance of chromosomes flexible hinge domain-containing protein GMI1 isoform X2 [Populus trichocarpa]